MSKKLVIVVLAALGLLAVLQTSASAATCLSYKTIGGSSMCVAWATKGILAEVKFKQECGPTGDGCSARARATANDVIAFCQNTTTGQINRRPCTTNVTFFGSSVPGQCDGKHPQDGTFTDGVGHLHHGCTTRFQLFPSGGQECCQAGEVLRDVTPVEMDTTLVASYFFPSGGDIVITEEGPPAPGNGCSSDSSFSECSVQQHCSINPKKIVFINPISEGPLDLSGSREYQCNITGVTNGDILDD